MKLWLDVRVVAFPAVLCLSGLLINCGAGITSEVPPKKAKLTRIVIAPLNQDLAKGASMQFNATGDYDDGKSAALTAAKWQTSQPTIATINDQGNLHALGLGQTRVSASWEGITGSTSVTVEAPSLLGVTVSPSQSSLPVGESEHLTATGNYSDGMVQNLSQSATWISTGSAIAVANPTGSVTANGIGTVTINASVGTVTGAATVTVTPPAAVSLTVTPVTSSVVLEGSNQFQAIATLSDGTTQNMTASAIWSSAQPDIASVSNRGLALGQRVGSTTIAAAVNGLEGSANLTVTPLMLVNYFNRASAGKSGVDGTVRLTSPGEASGDLCAMVYVVDQSQALSECCGCSISDGGLRSMSLLNDLTANPLTGKKSQGGTIKVVPSDIAHNPKCDPASLSPNGVVVGWGSNVQPLPDGTVQVTETDFELLSLSSVNATVLAGECGFIEQNGGGKGICSCGAGH